MDFWTSTVSRRGLLRGGLALGAAALLPANLFAEELLRTPRLTEGPFYPDRLPLDTDNDFIIINKSLTPAIGETTASS
jgi:protocatechuate 3,4-dioxygenase beta subunit